MPNTINETPIEDVTHALEVVAVCALSTGTVPGTIACTVKQAVAEGFIRKTIRYCATLFKKVKHHGRNKNSTR
jgi:hypothetical protein